MFYTLDEYPCLGSKGLSLYPDEWDDQQDMSPTRVRFTPASGALSGVDTWFEYYRGLNDLISAGGRSQIGVRTAAVATFNGYNFDPQRAANPVIAYDAVASLPVLGGLYNDFRAVVYNSKIRLFIAIYGNPSGSNRTAIFESTDGFTFTYVGEAQKDATYLGRTIGALANVSGTLVSLVSIADGAGGGNGRQKWISLDGGLTWLDRGTAIHVGNEGDWNGLNYVGGTMQLMGDYYVALLPGMPFIGNNGSGDPYLDWPEAVGAFRIPAASILTADVLWEANSSNPLIIAGPTHNALWHMALFEDRGTTYSTVETWGVPGFENIGTATTRALRTTPYYGTESRVSSSQLYELKMASRHWLDHWAMPVVADGTYTLRHVQSGKFVAVADGEPVLTEISTIAEFALERELSFYTISNGDLCLSAIDDLMQTGFEFVENPGAGDNVNGQWFIMPWEDRPADQPQLVVLTNRYSRMALSMPRDTETDGAPLVQAPFLGHASMVFELAPVVRAGTATGQFAATFAEGVYGEATYRAAMWLMRGDGVTEFPPLLVDEHGRILAAGVIPALVVSPSVYRIVTGDGQSNAEGQANDDRALIYDVSQRNVLTLMRGALADQWLGAATSGGASTALNGATITAIGPLVPQIAATDTHGTLASEAAARVLADRGALVVTWSNAEGGQQIANLLPGAGAGYYGFANVVTALTAAQAVKPAGSRLVYDWLIMAQGEGNTTETLLGEYHNDYRAAVEAQAQSILGQYEPVRMLSAQCSSFGSGVQGVESIFAWAQGHADDGLFFCSGPTYPYPFSDEDYLHNTSLGHAMRGEFCAAVIKQIERVGKWLPLHALSATVTGANEITVTMSKPCEAATNDVVAAADNLGIKLTGGGISAVSVSGASIIITTSSSASGTSEVKFGLQGQSTPRVESRIPRTNIRAAEPMGVYSIPGAGLIYDWCAHHRVAVS